MTLAGYVVYGGLAGGHCVRQNVSYMVVIVSVKTYYTFRGGLEHL
jgi:hypothetical protein